MLTKSRPKIEIVIDYPSRVFNKHIYDKLTDYSTFTEVHYGGASSGKSHGVIQKVVFKACQDWKYPRKVLFLRKVGSTVYDSIFEDVKQCLDAWGLLDKCKVNNSAYRIELPNGAQFIFKGLDNPEKIKSIKGVSDIVMEEASEFTLDDYTQLTLRLRDKKHKQKQIFLMFNPVSKVNWTYNAFFVKSPKNTVVYHTSYKDNRFLDKVTIENIEELANRNEAYYKIYALGEFATLDKLVFPKYEVSEANYICVTRNADVSPDDEALEVTDDFRYLMQQTIHKRRRMAVVRLETANKLSEETQKYFCEKFEIEPNQIFRTKMPMKLDYIFGISGNLL